MANERISVDKTNHVATLTLNRPAKHNAFDGVALQEFGQSMDELSQDEDTRVIIITAKPRSDSISTSPLVRIRYSPRLFTTARSLRLPRSMVLLLA
jgi:hypothetical protein